MHPLKWLYRVFENLCHFNLGLFSIQTGNVDFFLICYFVSIQWLQDTFQPFLTNWENEINILEIDDEKKKKRMYLSQQTSTGLKIAIEP